MFVHSCHKNVWAMQSFQNTIWSTKHIEQLNIEGGKQPAEDVDAFSLGLLDEPSVPLHIKEAATLEDGKNNYKFI